MLIRTISLRSVGRQKEDRKKHIFSVSPSLSIEVKPKTLRNKYSIASGKTSEKKKKKHALKGRKARRYTQEKKRWPDNKNMVS